MTSINPNKQNKGGNISEVLKKVYYIGFYILERPEGHSPIFVEAMLTFSVFDGTCKEDSS